MHSRYGLKRLWLFGLLAVPVVMLASALLILGLRQPAGRADSLSAIAVPAVFRNQAEQALEKAGLFDQGSGASNFLVALSDFSKVVHVAFQEALGRLAEDDPRDTALLDSLRRSFTFDYGDETWSVIYFPSAGPHGEQALEALGSSGIPVLASWHGRGGERTAGTTLLALWLVPLAWSLFLTLSRPRVELRYRAVLAFLWLPLLPFGSISALVLALATIACSWSWYLSSVSSLDASGRYRRRLVFPLAALLRALPFLMAGMAMVWLDIRLALACVVITALAFLLIRYGGAILALDRAGMEHAVPQFIPIRPSILNAAYRKVIGSFAVLGACAMAFHAVWGFDAGAGKTGGSAEIVLSIAMEPVGSIPGDTWRFHEDYQKALTWGRLGSVRWGAEMETILPSGTGESLNQPGNDTENALHQALHSGYSPVISIALGRERIRSGARDRKSVV